MPENIKPKSKRGGPRTGSGRPQGRQNRATMAQKATLEELAKEYTNEALQTLVSVARDGESEAARVSAATAILDRGYGRPRQAVEMTGKDGGPIETKDVTDADDFDRRMAGLAARAATANGTGDTQH